MQIYLAARFGRRGELCMYKEDLEELGHNVTSRWLTQHQALDLADPKARYSDEERRIFAQHDFADVKRAECLIAFTEDPNAGTAVSGRRGGRHVELGMALALGHRTYVVGYRENVFCHLAPVIFCSDWEECVKLIGAVK